MDTYYFKKLKNAVFNHKDSKLEVGLRKMREDILASDDNEDEELLPILDFILELINPLRRSLTVCHKRIREENFIKNIDCDSLPQKYSLLTIKELYSIMCFDISPSLSHFLIEKTECSTIAKSDILQAISDNDFELFNSTIRNNNVEYKFASDVCSHVTFLSKSRENLEDDLADISDNDEGEIFSLDDYKLNIRAGYERQLETITNNLKEDDLPENEIMEITDYFSGVFEEIISLYQKEDIKTAMLKESVHDFYILCSALHLIAVNKYLTPTEILFFSNFVKKKVNEIPLAERVFTLFTKGEFLHEGFDIADIDIHDDKTFELIGTETVGTLPLLSESTIDTDKEEKIEEYHNCNKTIDVKSGCAEERTNDKTGIDVIIEEVFEMYPILKSPRAEQYLPLALENGYVSVKDNKKWEWSDNKKIRKVELAYFLSRIYFKDCTNIIMSEGRRKCEWHQSTDEDLFSKFNFPYSISEIRKAIKSLFDDDILQERSKRTNGHSPKNYKDIDHLIPNE